MLPPINKFGAHRTTCSQGHSHASKKEARRCEELRIMKMGGLIADIDIEPRFYFEINGTPLKGINGRRLSYRPDFAYTLRQTGRRVAEDVKGGSATKTEAYALRTALFRHLFPEIELREI